eukprot:356232-Chlamydomonas_euryale.AAC.29
MSRPTNASASSVVIMNHEPHSLSCMCRKRVVKEHTAQWAGADVSPVDARMALKQSFPGQWSLICTAMTAWSCCLHEVSLLPLCLLQWSSFGNLSDSQGAKTEPGRKYAGMKYYPRRGTYERPACAGGMSSLRISGDCQFVTKSGS